MAWIVEDRVQDSSSTEGTGNFTLDNNPPDGCRTLNAVCAASDTFPYSIQHRTLNQWEDGDGTYLGSHQFSRSPVRSSNANGLVSFSAGAKDVALVIRADMVEPIDGGTF